MSQIPRSRLYKQKGCGALVHRSHNGQGYFDLGRAVNRRTTRIDSFSEAILGSDHIHVMRLLSLDLFSTDGVYPASH